MYCDLLIKSVESIRAAALMCVATVYVLDKQQYITAPYFASFRLQSSDLISVANIAGPSKVLTFLQT